MKGTKSKYMKSTNKNDKYGHEIFVGDTLKCDHGYSGVVYEEDGEFYVRLICESKHPCANIPYALNPEISEIIGLGK